MRHKKRNRVLQVTTETDGQSDINSAKIQCFKLTSRRVSGHLLTGDQRPGAQPFNTLRKPAVKHRITTEKMFQAHRQ